MSTKFKIYENSMQESGERGGKTLNGALRYGVDDLFMHTMLGNLG